MKRNIERFPSKQMYPYLSLVKRKVADFYHNIDRRSWLVWVKMSYFHHFFRTIPGVLILLPSRSPGRKSMSVPSSPRLRAWYTILSISLFSLRFSPASSGLCSGILDSSCNAQSNSLKPISPLIPFVLPLRNTLWWKRLPTEHCLLLTNGVDTVNPIWPRGGGRADLPPLRANARTRKKSMGGNFDSFCKFLNVCLGTLKTTFYDQKTFRLVEGSHSWSETPHF